MRIKIGGKLIFSGEYALLEGGCGVVGCFEENIYFDISFDTSLKKDCKINSDRFGTIVFDFNDSVPQEFVLFQNVLQILDVRKVCIEIQNESAFTGGFGTSGACIVALCYFHLFHFQRHTGDWKNLLLQKSVTVLKHFYPNSSGVDIAGEIFGGLVYYDAKAIKALPMEYDMLHRYRIIAVDCGYKTPTSRCIEIINERHDTATKKELLHKISDCTNGIKTALLSRDCNSFEYHMNQNNDLMIELGVCDSAMFVIIEEMKKNDAKIVKISGSGLGDAILAFFEKESDLAWMQTNGVLKQYNWKELHLNQTGIAVNYA